MMRTPRRLLTTATTLASLAALASFGACSDAGQSTSAQESTATPTASSDGDATVSCDYVPGGPAAAEVDLPPAEPPAAESFPVTISTDQGDLDATLDAAAAPCTVNSFLSLAEQGYFDGTPCHRLTTEGIFVLQCGDPTGTGTGGPGYSFADEVDEQATYPAGTLAMANAGPDTNGSQFFIVYEDTDLPPAYTVFGTVDEAGLAAVRDVAADGVEGGGSDGAPATPIEITSVTQG